MKIRLRPDWKNKSGTALLTMPKMSVKRDVNSIENDREDLYNLYELECKQASDMSTFIVCEG